MENMRQLRRTFPYPLPERPVWSLPNRFEHELHAESGNASCAEFSKGSENMSENEGWIHIVSDGQNKIASPDYVKQKILGICAIKQRIDALESEVENLKAHIFELEAPKREQQILKLMKEDGSKHTLQWFDRRVPPFSKSKYWDLDNLVKQGKVNKTKSKHHSFYELTREVMV